MVPVQMYNWTKYEGSKFNHVVIRAKNKLGKMAAI